MGTSVSGEATQQRMRTTPPFSPAEPHGARRRAVLAVVVWSVVLAAALASALRAGAPPVDVARSLLYWAGALVLPGTVVLKALVGTRGSWLADLACGAGLGLVLELFAWVGASLTDLRGLLWAWPLATASVLLLPRARARVLRRPPHRAAAGPTVATGVAALLAVWHLDSSFMDSWALPPSGRPWFQDLLWHMGLVHEAMRSFPLGTPQVVGDGLLQYHWFSDAHLAAQALITGTAVPVVVLRTWFMPVAVLFVALTAVLGARLSRSDWGGAGAALLVSSILSAPFWPGIVTAGNHLNPLSPSQLYALPLTVLFVLVLCEIVGAPTRPVTRPSPGLVVVAVLLAVGCAGAKSSALPVVLGGVVTSLLVALVMRRRRLVLAVTAAALAVVTLAGLRLVAGGGASSGFQLLSAMSLLPPYRTLVTAKPDLDRPWLDGLVHTPGVGPLLLVALALALSIAYVRLLSFVLPFLQRSLRRDLRAWLLAGTCAVSVVPFLVLSHTGYSQFYFVQGAIPFGAVLWVWSLVELVRRSPGSRQVTVAALAVGALVTAVVGQMALSAPRATDRTAVLASLSTFVLQVGAVAAALLVVLAFALSRRRRGDARWVPVTTALLLSPIVVSGVLLTANRPDAQQVSASVRPSVQVLAQTQAAEWISRHVPDDDLVATNDHCSTGSGPACNSRQWWLSGIAGRRVLLESWGYTPSAMRLERFDDRALYDLNQSAFVSPTPEVLAALRRRGVSWLVGERSPGLTVSRDLDRLADRRYDNGRVVVYRLR
ncbi:hypothetical protein [Terracoccus luteus]|uniref:hypothetical protein n=1 Tax=Terracoccus luteus TaxID=53356 RepID=UPI000EB3D446|nr:hypothetical protein [Terracoccus luteus]